MSEEAVKEVPLIQEASAEMLFLGLVLNFPCVVTTSLAMDLWGLAA